MATATSVTSLPVFPPFNVHEDCSNVATRWTKWLRRFENMLEAMGVSDTKRKKAMLLHYGGEDICEIFEGLQLDETPSEGETSDTYKTLKDALTLYFMPQVNVDYEVYKFRECKQNQDETLDAYNNRLRRLAKTCDFTNIDRELKSQLILGCTSSKLRRRALREPKLTLASLLEIGRTMELSEDQAKKIEDNVQLGINKIDVTTQGNVRKSFVPDRDGPRPVCYYCGGKHMLGRDYCPAAGQACNSCGKLNHFSKVCQQTRRQQRRRQSYPQNSRGNPHQRGFNSNQRFPQQYPFFQQQPSTQSGGHVANQVSTNPDLDVWSPNDDAYIFATTNMATGKIPTTEITVNGVDITMMVDTAASVNIIDQVTYTAIGQPSLSQSDIRLFTYGRQEQIPVSGKVKVVVGKGNIIRHSDFYVVCGTQSGNLLTYVTARQLGVIGEVNNITPVHQPQTSQPSTLGKLKDYQVHLHIDPTVKGVIQTRRRIPLQLRDPVERELQRLQDLDIIEPVNEPSTWVSPIVVVPKANSKEIRICVDMREANRAIKRQRHVMPTIDDVIFELHGAKYFSKIDLKNAYHQLELDSDSRAITTFATHIGLFRYKRLMFGVNTAAEIFQKTLSQVLQGLKGVFNISDDTLVFGKTRREHDNNLKAVLEQLRTAGLTVNLEKCLIGQTNVRFYGLVFGADGVSPDPKKVQDILAAPDPQTSSEVRSLLGMLNYSSRFIPNFASITYPLRLLTRKDAKWEWSTQHKEALATLKRLITQQPVMAYIDPTKSTEIYVDASPVGLGAILMQKTTPDATSQTVAYASRALTATEQRYSQLEREALAVIWACQHFHLYVYGSSFTIITDHKPLEKAFLTPVPSARIERWALQLQNYCPNIVYQPGADNPADFLSRHPVSNATPKIPSAPEIVEAHIQMIMNAAIPNAMSLPQVKEATLADVSMVRLAELIHNGKWHEACSRPGENIDNDFVARCAMLKDELTTTTESDVILRGRRIVLPKSLQRQAITLAHTGHQGLVKTKQLLRTKVWFPNIDKLVEQHIQSCIPCQAVTDKKVREPLQMTELPAACWQKVAADFKGPLPDGKYLLVVVDLYSRYPFVKTVTSTSAMAVIPKLDELFAEHGTPVTLITDNGPPFSGVEFERFAESLGFKHQKITPLWPQANGEVERVMRTLNKAIQIASVEGTPRMRVITEYLRNYRATPHTTTGKTPAELLFKRSIRVRLPEYSVPESDDQLRERDAAQKARMKHYADGKQATSSTIDIGDMVLVRQKRQNKTTPPFDPVPYVVERRHGTQVTARRPGHMITRNVSFFKQIPKRLHPERKEEEEEFDDIPVIPSGSEDDNTSQVEPRIDNDTCQPEGEPDANQIRRYPRRERHPPNRYGFPNN